jgi:hypothetical protein
MLVRVSMRGVETPVDIMGSTRDGTAGAIRGPKACTSEEVYCKASGQKGAVRDPTIESRA